MRSTPEAKGKRTIVPLFLIVGILAIAGLAWQSYPTIKSAFQRRPDQKEFSAQERPQQKPIVPATTPARTESESSDLSSARESLKTASIETTPHGQILEQKEIKPDQLVASQRRGKEKIKPPVQTTEGHPAVQKREVAHVQVSENRAVTEIEAAEPQASPNEVSIENFVEKWRRSWEEGDVQTYIGCYHAGFTSRGMDIQAWKSHKQRLFSLSAKRNVQLSDMQIQANGSSAVVTFTQSYQAAKHLDVGLKTLKLRRHQDRWTILKENWYPIPAQG
jgi:hypothetical protein